MLAAAAAVVFEDDRLDEALDEQTLIGLKAGDGLEAEPEVFIRGAFSSSKPKRPIDWWDL